MKCTSCGADNEAGARFCGNCGAAVGAPPTPPAGPSSVTCPNCSSINPTGSNFCENCGVKIGTAPAHATVQASEAPLVKTSSAWWLLPIFIPYLGGIIAGLAVKKRDKNKAKWLSILGIVMLFVWAIVANLIIQWQQGAI